VQVYRSLGHPLNAGEAVNALTRQLDTVYRQLAKNFADNQAVSLDFTGKRTKLTIAHLNGLDEPPAQKLLSKRISELLPVVDLTELLLEINAHTGFADEFTHASESGARMDDLTVSICAVLLAEACNIGMEPFIRPNIPALTRYRLSWTRQNYLRAETLVKANARLVDYQSTLLLAQKWGGGEVASADGMRFIAPVRTVHAGSNRKYFGSSRGDHLVQLHSRSVFRISWCCRSWHAKGFHIYTGGATRAANRAKPNGNNDRYGRLQRPDFWPFLVTGLSVFSAPG